MISPAPPLTPTLAVQAQEFSRTLGVPESAARAALLTLLNRLDHDTLRAMRIEAVLLNRALDPAPLSSEPVRKPA